MNMKINQLEVENLKRIKAVKTSTTACIFMRTVQSHITICKTVAEAMMGTAIPATTAII